MKILEGTVHKLPNQLKLALISNKKALATWQSLTDLARNEWICWLLSPKKEETRKNHLKRLIEELVDGKKRPCCWIGCTHRKDKKLSPSVKYLISKK
jgi:uncharacterized protein YdeI (YjbR/CyaY-like superfamily)